MARLGSVFNVFQQHTNQTLRGRAQEQALSEQLHGGFRRGGGSRGGNTQLSELIAQLMASNTSANEANEARFAEGQGLLEQLGVAGQEDIQRNAASHVAESGQNLASRGLSGTTIGQGNANQIQANAQLNAQKLRESVAAQQVGFIERRTDEGPDMALIAQLIQQNQATQPGRRRFRFGPR